MMDTACQELELEPNLHEDGLSRKPGMAKSRTTAHSLLAPEQKVADEKLDKLALPALPPPGNSPESMSFYHDRLLHTAALVKELSQQAYHDRLSAMEPLLDAISEITSMLDWAGQRVGTEAARQVDVVRQLEEENAARKSMLAKMQLPGGISWQGDEVEALKRGIKRTASLIRFWRQRHAQASRMEKLVPILKAKVGKDAKTVQDVIDRYNELRTSFTFTI